MFLIATYQLSSDVPSLYAPGNLALFAPQLERAGAVAMARDQLAMFVISHCGLARDLYLRQLFKFMPIDSYGKCLNTTDLPAHTEYEASEVSHRVLCDEGAGKLRTSPRLRQADSRPRQAPPG